MKNCPNCNIELGDSIEICWNCGHSMTENKIVNFEEKSVSYKKDIKCLRCGTVRMSYSGNYKFHEGKRLGVFGDFFELFVNKKSFDIYVCPKCGKMEFYVPE
jgi:Zn finger protein HypA/HybF involved in hydrogenase expression